MTAEASAKPRVPRSAWILIALVLCVAALAFYQIRRARAGRAVASASASAASRSGDGTMFGEAPPDVRLGALEPEWPELAESARNPFRFQPKAPPAPPQPAAVAARPAAPVAGGTGNPGGAGAPAVQAPPPPIPLKFIGTIEAPGVGKLAALSDGKFVYHGREGEIIEGRYRIVKIGVESIVMEHADGRGRQTIRLTG